MAGGKEVKDVNEVKDVKEERQNQEPPSQNESGAPEGGVKVDDGEGGL